MASAQKTFISSTNWTERIGPVAAIATIRKHGAVDAAKHLVALGERVQSGWLESASRNGLSIHVEGMKPMGHFNFEGDRAQAMKAYFIQLMLEQGFLASNLFYAMYAHTFDHVSRYLAATDSAFEQIVYALAQGDLEKRLLGKPSSVGFRRVT